MVLQDNSGDNMTVAANGVFTFATKVANGSPYSVTIFSQPAGQNCSIANGTGTIALADVSNVAITCGSDTNTIGGTVSGLNGSMVLQDNGGSNLTVAVNGTFTFATTVPFGNPYDVTVLNQPLTGQTCTVSSGSGTVAANVANVAVNCVKNTALRYVYAANMADNSVSTYVVNNTNGLLKYISKVAAGTNPSFVTIDPSGKHAYVTNAGNNNVSQFNIGTSGTLTPMAPSTVAAGLSPYSVTIDPSGKYAYVANSFNGAGGNSISQYTVGADGTLTAMSPATVATGGWPHSVTIDPSGKYAYVANYWDATVSQYTIGATGALAAMTSATVGAGLGPKLVTVDPSGKYAYVANSLATTVSQYAIGANGALAPMTPATVSAGTYPSSVAIDPAGKYAYATNSTNGAGGNTVSQYTIDANGALAAMTPATVAAGVSPISIAVEPSGKYAFVANWDNSVGGNSVMQYTIGASGRLTLTTTSKADGSQPASVAVSAGAVPVQAVPRNAYVVNKTGNSVSQYSINQDGSLSALATATVAAGTTPYAITVDPTGKYAYVANSFNGAGGNSVSQFNIGADGVLTPMSTPTVAAGTSPQFVAIDPSGKYAYVANYGSANISQYTIGATGALAPMASVTASTYANPTSVVVDASGKYAYVTNRGSNLVSQYNVGAGGSLGFMAPQTAATGTFPDSIASDPYGKYVYATNWSTGNISQFTIGASGLLSAMTPAAVSTGSQPYFITIDPSGKYAYVANGAGGTVSQYTVGPSGGLTPMIAPTVATGLWPMAISVDLSGKYAYVVNSYVANSTSGTISQYTIDAVTGALTNFGGTVATGDGPNSIVTTGTWQ
jgi:6-phosphogluconolactonase (cycloisomerase 2 family)